MIETYYRTPGMSASSFERLLARAVLLGVNVENIQTENSFYVKTKGRPNRQDKERLRYLLRATYNPTHVGESSFLDQEGSVIEFGPRMNFETPWSSRAVDICRRVGITKVERFEHSIRIGLPTKIKPETALSLIEPFHDPMLEMIYDRPLTSFSSGMKPAPVRVIPLLEEGETVLWLFDKQHGCGWNKFLVQWIASIFFEIGRNPTDVELFQIAQMCSEHARHWTFRGEIYIDGVRIPEKNLMEIIKSTQKYTGANSVIAFNDDSSAIKGRVIELLMASRPGYPSELVLLEALYHPTLTAETHNFPSGIAPYPGAATGTGGRIRDNQAVGRGGIVRASDFGVCTGNYHIPGYPMPWEQNGWTHPPDLVSPLEIRLQGTNGGYDYGNCIGEPNTGGFIETFEMELPDGHRGWYKPVVYTVGTGGVLDEHVQKGFPEKGMLLVQIGPPSHRIGMGGSSGSSREQDGANKEKDQNAVQRGEPEAAQRGDRVIVACYEKREDNPIVSMTDLGAGGVLNAFTELVDPAGALINIRAIPVGDHTMSVLEVYGNESQERNGVLVYPDRFDELKRIAEREDCQVAIIGQITGDGLLIVHDDNDGTNPVELPLAAILGDLPPEQLHFTHVECELPPFVLPPESEFREWLGYVLRHPHVCSKMDLVTKVDHTVKAFTAQYQLVGRRLLPISDYSLVAHSHTGLTATARSLGMQPTIGLIDAGAGARMTVAEACLNVIGAGYEARNFIEGQLNWMLPVRQPGQGAWLVDSARAAVEILRSLGIGIDGGKDSTSMASQGINPEGDLELVKCPGLAVLALYALVEDLNVRATADLKMTGNTLLLVSCSDEMRLGGSVLGLVTGQLGNEAPDIDNQDRLVRIVDTINKMVRDGLIASVHDTVRVGPIPTLIEMALAGDRGFDVDLRGEELYATMLNGEASLIIEVPQLEAYRVEDLLRAASLPYHKIGKVAGSRIANVSHNGRPVFSETLASLRRDWEETAYQMDRLQSGDSSALEEWNTLSDEPLTAAEIYTFNPDDLPKILLGIKPKAAILRERGSNGDREMAEALRRAGFAPWDVKMSDLSSGTAKLDDYKFMALPGGFSFGDTLESGTGWAAVMRFDEGIRGQIDQFYGCDTLSLAVCNGCQVSALHGVPDLDLPDEEKPLFTQNRSGHFEHRYVMLQVAAETNAVMLGGMQGSVLGVGVAHGEGLFQANPEVMDMVLRLGLAPLRYVDPDGLPTETRPYNPNGSPHGIAGLCSPDGHHLLMMPHPERFFLRWQLPYSEYDGLYQNSHWAKFFTNARAYFG